MINLNKTHISFNQNDLDRLIFALHMIGNMSAANIQCLIAQYYGFSFEQAPSTRYIEKVINNPITLQKGQKALENLDQLVAPNVKHVAGDELCSHPKYLIYSSCVPYAGYNLNLNAFDDHTRGKKDVWGLCYGPLKDMGLNPLTTTSDQAAGTMAGHKASFKDATHIADFFHLYQNFNDLLKKAQSEEAKLYKAWEELYNNITAKHTQTKSTTQPCPEYLSHLYTNESVSGDLALHIDYNLMSMVQDLYKKYLQADQDLKDMGQITENIQTLLSWFTGYILTLAGDNIKDRIDIYDFICDSLKNCAKLGITDKCLEIANSMERQIEKLLNFLPHLNQLFEEIVELHNQNKQENNMLTLTTEHLWKINKFLHYQPKDTNKHNLVDKTCNSNLRAADLKNEIVRDIGEPLFRKLVKQIHTIHQNTVTCSSFIENNIGRIKPFFMKGNMKITQEKLDMIRLLINTSPIHSSRDYSKRAKTPLQLMLGDEHNIQWLDLLFDKPVIRQRGLKHPQIPANHKTLPKAA